jgi:hypothetical protein
MAVWAEDWQAIGDGRFYRNFDGENREVVADRKYGAHAVAVYAHAVQHDDGGIIDNGSSDPVFEPPGISVLTIDHQHGRPTDIGLTPQRCGATSR